MSASTSNPRVILITGAAGGLGQALVAEFLEQGWCVAAGFRSATPHKESEPLWPVKLEVTDRGQVRDVVKGLVARWGRIDALVNNAGVTSDHLVAQMSDTDWDEVLKANLKGAFLCAQAVLPSMLKQRDGHIIQIVSFAARVGAAGQANYAAAKAGLIGLTTSLAREVGSRNVRVNAVLPGIVRTTMTAKLAETQLAEFAAANALGRLNEPAEVARFIGFLTTTRNVSGQVFQLDSRIGRWA